ncbi:TPA: hypothetical protein ACOL2E_002866 [Vibrio parahaemolyticus]
MTLLVAWKLEDELGVAADTRVSSGDSVISDNGGKILSFNVESQRFDGEQLVERYQCKYGFAFCGSTLLAQNAHAIASTCAQMFWSNTEKCAPSLLDITNVYRHAAREVTNDINFRKMQGELSVFEGMIFGYCPEKQNLGIGLVSPSKNPQGGIDYTSQVLFLDNGQVYHTGSGSEEFKRQLEIKDQHGNPRPVLKLIEAVIDEDSVPSVGGDIQLATATEKSVDISAVLKQCIDDPEKVTITVNGVSVDNIEGLSGFAIGKTVTSITDTQKILRREAIKRAGYDPDFETPPDDELNTGILLTMIDLNARSNEDRLGVIDQNMIVKNPNVKSGQRYFCAMCGCGSVTPILQDEHEGRVKTPFRGEGLLIINCKGCRRKLGFKAASVVSMIWLDSMLTS